jgi:hypothetical protein
MGGACSMHGRDEKCKVSVGNCEVKITRKM